MGNLGGAEMEEDRKRVGGKTLIGSGTSYTSRDRNRHGGNVLALWKGQDCSIYVGGGTKRAEGVRKGRRGVEGIGCRITAEKKTAGLVCLLGTG